MVVTRKRPKRYLTKYRKKVKNCKERAKKKDIFEKALKDCARGRFSSVKKCAAYHKVAYSTLYCTPSSPGARSTRGQEELTRSCLLKKKPALWLMSSGELLLVVE